MNYYLEPIEHSVNGRSSIFGLYLSLCVRSTLPAYYTEGKETLPFVVNRTIYSVRYPIVVEEIEGNIAYGFPIKPSTESNLPWEIDNDYMGRHYSGWAESRVIPNAGSYQWELFNTEEDQLLYIVEQSYGIYTSNQYL